MLREIFAFLWGGETHIAELVLFEYLAVTAVCPSKIKPNSTGNLTSGNTARYSFSRDLEDLPYCCAKAAIKSSPKKQVSILITTFLFLPFAQGGIGFRGFFSSSVSSSDLASLIS